MGSPPTSGEGPGCLAAGDGVEVELRPAEVHRVALGEPAPQGRRTQLGPVPRGFRRVAPPTGIDRPGDLARRHHGGIPDQQHPEVPRGADRNDLRSAGETEDATRLRHPAEALARQIGEPGARGVEDRPDVVHPTLPPASARRAAPRAAPSRASTIAPAAPCRAAGRRAPRACRPRRAPRPAPESRISSSTPMLVTATMIGSPVAASSASAARSLPDAPGGTDS